MQAKIAGPQTINVFRVYDADVNFVPVYPQDFAVETLSGAPNGPCDYCEHTITYYARSTLYNGPSVIGIAPIELVIPPTSTLQNESIFHSTDIQLLVGIDGEKVCMDVGAGGKFSFWGRNVTVSALVPKSTAILGYPAYYIGNFSDAREVYRDGGLPENIVVVNDFISVTLGTCQVANSSRRPRLTRMYTPGLIEQASQGANVFRVPDRACKVTVYGSDTIAGAIRFFRDGQIREVLLAAAMNSQLPIDVPGNARYFTLNITDTAVIPTLIWELDF